MVSVMSAIGKRADEAMAMPALEYLLGGLRITRPVANLAVVEKIILEAVLLRAKTCLFIQTQKLLA